MKKLELLAVVITILGFIVIPLNIVSFIRETLTPSVPETTGVLLPNNKPIPSHPCNNIPPGGNKIPTGAFMVILGNSAMYSTNFPFSIVKIFGKSLLSIDKKDNGILVSGIISSRDNRVIVEIRNNKFYINSLNFFRMERPDKHSLIVYDQEATKVFDVRYFNPTTIQFLGVFTYNSSAVIFDEERVEFRTPRGSSYTSGSCNSAIDTGWVIGD